MKRNQSFLAGLALAMGVAASLAACEKNPVDGQEKPAALQTAQVANAELAARLSKALSPFKGIKTLRCARSPGEDWICASQAAFGKKPQPLLVSLQADSGALGAFEVDLALSPKAYSERALTPDEIGQAAWIARRAAERLEALSQRRRAPGGA